MRLLVSAYLWVLAFATLFIGVPLALVAIAVLPRPRAYRVLQAIFRLPFRLAGIHIRLHGLERLDLDRPYIFMGNHVNLLDPFVFACVWPRPFIGVEKKENFKLPIYGWLMRRWGNIPIDRRNLEQAKKDLARAAEIIRREGLWMFVFPEGTRTLDGMIGPFKKGGFHLALDTGVPIVPFTVNGLMEIKTTHRPLLQRHDVDIWLHEAVDPRAYDREHLDALIAAVRTPIVAAYEPPPALPGA